jgi:D-serine deaminase-like pyridoxal phosphate-dependent protein
MNFISRPGLILNKDKCIANIKGMVQKAAASGMDFRPHFKTHQSLEVGNWFRELGVNKITVSSLSMASYFLNDGWNNITVAFPLNLREIDFLDELAGRAEIHQTILSLESAARMEKELKNRLNIWVKIDTGAGRTGLVWDDFNTLDELLEFLRNSKKLNFSGFLIHAGHTYRARIKEEVEFIYNDSVEKLGILKERYYSVFPNLKISWGDTPSCSIIENFQGIDEIRPGNFVFYDIMQSIIGSCREDEIAIALACPVVAKHPDRRMIIVYGGGVHLSKDSMILHDGTEIFGKIALPEGNSWGKSQDNCYVSSLSQEHGMLKVSNEVFNRVNEGDIVYILPVHSCMTADLMQGYRLLDGTDVDHMSAKIHKSWH